MRFPWAPVHSPRDVVNSIHLKERDFFKQVDHPDTKATFRYPGLPFKSSAFPVFTDRPAPMKGQDNDLIYINELGMERNELDRLVSIDVI